MQIKQLFGFCGAVIGVDKVGDQKQFLFVEYTYPSVQFLTLHSFVLTKFVSSGDRFASLSDAIKIGFNSPHLETDLHP